MDCQRSEIALPAWRHEGQIGSQKSMLGLGTCKTMDEFVIENNRAKVVLS
jgi:hypothetical protein